MTLMTPDQWITLAAAVSPSAAAIVVAWIKYGRRKAQDHSHHLDDDGLGS